MILEVIVMDAELREFPCTLIGFGQMLCGACGKNFGREVSIGNHCKYCAAAIVGVRDSNASTAAPTHAPQSLPLEDR
jgi:hypothetical protein